MFGRAGLLSTWVAGAVVIAGVAFAGAAAAEPKVAVI